uniref:Uncharacterized protein n=1 Tax=Meloidogyne javanica TaxID=6303 RepID=A0A915N5X5_MELJA
MQKRTGFQYARDDPIIYSFEFDCDNEENINIIVKMFKEKANDKQLYDIHYLTIKYLIENSQKIQKFFEEYANTENEEDANKSKNRLYNLIGNELGNLEIEYPILIQFEETDEESLYLTEDELEESINAEIRINASLLFATFQGIYDLFVEEVKKVLDIDDVENSTDDLTTDDLDDLEKRIKEKHLTTLGVFIRNENFKKDMAISKLLDAEGFFHVRTEEERKAQDEEYLKTIALWDEEALKEKKRYLIDIGIIINEIYKRFNAFKQLKDKIWPLIYEEIFGKEIFEKMPKWLENLTEDEQNKVMGNTPIELYKQLKELVHLIEGTWKVDNKNIKENPILNERNIYFIIHQLHLQKLISSRNILFIKEKNQNLKENIISIIFGVEESKQIEEWFNRIDEQINDWNKFKDQRDIGNY